MLTLSTVSDCTVKNFHMTLSVPDFPISELLRHSARIVILSIWLLINFFIITIIIIVIKNIYIMLKKIKKGFLALVLKSHCAGLGLYLGPLAFLPTYCTYLTTYHAVRISAIRLLVRYHVFYCVYSQWVMLLYVIVAIANM